MVSNLRNMSELAGQEDAHRLAHGLDDDRIVPLLSRIAIAVESLVEQAEGRSAPRARRARRVQEATPSRRQIMARSFIEVTLRSSGPMSWEDLVAHAAKWGHREMTLRRARSEVAVSERVDGRWVWRLRNRDGSP